MRTLRLGNKSEGEDYRTASIFGKQTLVGEAEQWTGRMEMKIFSNTYLRPKKLFASFFSL